MTPGTIPFTQGLLTNPTINTLVADTGAMAANGVNIKIIVGASVASRFAIEWRNAANTANLWSQIVANPANQSISVDLPVGIPFAAGERLRIIMAAALTGVAQGSIIVY